MMSSPFRATALAAALAAVLVLSGCAAYSGPTVVEGEEVEVKMYDAGFQYTEIRIPVGGSVTWVGSSRLPHNAVAADGSWSTETVFGSLEQRDGDKARLVYDTAGTFVFFCTFHGNAQGAGMAGKLIVGD
jgi:plastocyanin